MLRTLMVATLALAAFGCKKKSSESTESSGTATGTGQGTSTETGSGTAAADGPATGSGTAAGSGSDTVGADQMGTFTCKDVQDDACVGSTDTFEATVPVVHVTYKTKDLPKAGDVYVIQWIAEDVGQAAPPNTVIGTLNEEVKEVAAGTQNYVVNSKLTKPTKGWPVGKYRVEIKRGDKVETTARFSIQ